MSVNTVNAKTLRQSAIKPLRSTQPRRAPFANCSRPTRQCLQSAQTRLEPLYAGKLDDLQLFADPVVGGSAATTAPKTPAVSTAQALDNVPLETEAGIDYTTLRDHLKAGDFRKADDETRALLIKLAGENAVKRGWVYFTEVKFISVKDLQTMDKLWKAGSNNKFGYSVQKEVYMKNQKRWPKFFQQIDWTQGEFNVYRKWPAEFIYSLDAPKGHLPLTNALRGTQLFEAVMEHPAFAKPEKTASPDNGKALLNL